MRPAPVRKADLVGEGHRAGRRAAGETVPAVRVKSMHEHGQAQTLGLGQEGLVLTGEWSGTPPLTLEPTSTPRSPRRRRILEQAGGELGILQRDDPESVEPIVAPGRPTTRSSPGSSGRPRPAETQY